MLKLTYIGHSAFLLEDDDGHVVAIDPFITGNPTAAIPASEVKPTTILITHAHNDHVGDAMDLARKHGAGIVTTVELANWIGSQGLADVTGGNLGGTVAFPHGTVKFTQAWHSSSYTHEGQQVAHGIPAGLIVRFGGSTIYFAGDTALFGDMRLIGDEGIDLAVLPIGDFFTMGPADAARAVEFVRPKAVIPCHYNTFPPIKQDPETFRAAVGKTAPATAVVILAPGETHTL
jgi:L-ascorbate metabolism protein UlaG (beta-lactamase superfamily)